MHRRKIHESLNLKCCGAWLGAALALCLSQPSAATPVVAQLRNGDRITGELLAQETNHVVIATGWAGTMAIPLSAIGGLQTTTGDKLIPAAVPAAPTTPPASPAPAKTASAKPAPSAPPRPAAPRKVQTNLQIGSNLNFGAKDSELLYGRLKATYTQPYERNPKKFFRTLGDISADYGETEQVRSANRVYGSIKTDFDSGERAYFYNVFSSGYDEIRKIDLQYAAGPGLGYHALRLPLFELDLESGLDYQAQNRSTGEDTSNVYGRLSDSLTWKLNSRLSFTKKFEYYFNVEDVAKFRFRLDSTLSYRLVENLSLNLSVLDTFDTDPAPKVDKNEMQIRSSIGITF
jgi:putative salt-induced outer membrane protein YdiY